MAGTARLHYPANVRLLRFPCTGRMNPMFIVKAFERGADGVLVSGCHPGDCHYVHGNLVARRRFTVFRSLMDLLGLDQGRLHFSWVSAAEGHKWVRVVEEVTESVRSAGPLPGWRATAREAGSPSLPLPAVEASRQPPAQSELDPIALQLRREVANLLEQGQVPRVLGYANGSLPGQVTMTTITGTEEVGELEWSPHCHPNLLAYVPRALEHADRVGVVVKACDVKSLVGLLQEGQVQRQDVVLVGAPCAGVWEGDRLAAKCNTCDGEVPSICDVAVGVTGAESAVTERPTSAQDPRDEQLAVLESLPAAERWAFWQSQFERCLRCYACRAVCPLCYCETCISDQHRPQWIPITIDQRGNTAWNVIRAFHLAGRCTGCDECSRVCPADIRLDLLNRKLALEVERQYGYRSGEDPEATPAMAEFKMEDAGEFIL